MTRDTMEFFLNFKVPLLIRHMRVFRNSKEAKEVHNLARKMLKQSKSALGSSPGNCPDLGLSFEQATEGIISCTPHPKKY